MSAVSSDQELFCPHCGASTEGDPRFCRACGKQLAGGGVPGGSLPEPEPSESEPATDETAKPEDEEIAEGWYPDPDDETERWLRYWDGGDWSSTPAKLASRKERRSLTWPAVPALDAPEDQVASSNDDSDVTTKLTHLADLVERGFLDRDEYDKLKSELLKSL